MIGMESGTDVIRHQSPERASLVPQENPTLYFLQKLNYTATFATAKTMEIPSGGIYMEGGSFLLVKRAQPLHCLPGRFQIDIPADNSHYIRSGTDFFLDRFIKPDCHKEDTKTEN